MRRPAGRWSMEYVACVECRGTDAKMVSKGRCARCYLKAYRTKYAKKIAAQKKEWNKRQYPERGKRRRELMYFDGKREAVLKRDKYCCVRCGSRKRLVVHHKDGRGRSVRNRTTTCEILRLCAELATSTSTEPKRWRKGGRARRIGRASSIAVSVAARQKSDTMAADSA
jgi:hypothetical protein